MIKSISREAERLEYNKKASFETAKKALKRFEIDPTPLNSRRFNLALSVYIRAEKAFEAIEVELQKEHLI